eukprot:4408318-Alexandrium_andersonii.AAC.1
MPRVYDDQAYVSSLAEKQYTASRAESTRSAPARPAWRKPEAAASADRPAPRWALGRQSA